MGATADLVLALRHDIGEDSAANSHLGTTSVIPVEWLNQAQRRLCASGNLLVSGWYGNSDPAVEFYIVPSDYYRIVALHVIDGTTRYKINPNPGGIRHRSKTTVGQNIPTYYGMWGANDSSGNNKDVIFFEPNFNVAGKVIEVYAAQMPKTMVDDTQGPELNTYWQDGMLTYCRMKFYLRMANGDSSYRTMAQDARSEWESFVQEAKRFRWPTGMDVPSLPVDLMEYTVER